RTVIFSASLNYLFVQFCRAALCASAAEKRDYEALYFPCQHPLRFSFLFALANDLNCCMVFTDPDLSAAFLLSAQSPALLLFSPRFSAGGEL
ncbi:hypothetical protein ACO0K9_25770, partial [Undibacterium sp. Ji50W]|uniref:hypothetical protein n=1 Tax=Undibacterium sp. Ji50W TaxID=3413041 RepID=UPI003BF17BF5